MKKLIYLAIIGLTLAITAGCANGPLSSWLKGAPCNTCQPPLQPSSGTQSLAPCTNGCQTNSAIPSPIIQPTPGGAITGPIGQAETSYYSANDPTTQQYQTQPYVDPAQPVYGNLPGNFGQPTPAVGSGTIGSGSRGNVLTPPSFNFSVN